LYKTEDPEIISTRFYDAKKRWFHSLAKEIRKEIRMFHFIFKPLKNATKRCWLKAFELGVNDYLKNI